MLIGIVPLAIIGAIVGVLAARCLTGEYTHWLRRAFGGFLELVVLFNLYQARRAAQGRQTLGSTCPMPQRHWLLGAVVGLPAGLIAGLLGIGGGVWAVPSQRLFLGIQLRNAIANSSCMIIGVAIATATAQSMAVTTMQLKAIDGWWLSVWLAPGGIARGLVWGQPDTQPPDPLDSTRIPFTLGRNRFTDNALLTRITQSDRKCIETRNASQPSKSLLA